MRKALLIAALSVTVCSAAPASAQGSCAPQMIRTYGPSVFHVFIDILGFEFVVDWIRSDTC